MSLRRQRRKVFLVLTFLASLMGVVMVSLQQHWQADRREHHKDHQLTDTCLRVRSDTFTQVPGSKTLLINAFREHRTENASIRLLGIVLREEHTQWSRCVFCCQEDGEVVTVAAERTTHPSHYYFEYVTGDFLCQIPFGCNPRYAGLFSGDMDLTNLTLLPVLNQEAPERSSVPLKYTLCMPTMFNRYNNVLQFVQAMELYQLLGIQKAIIYKTSCSAIMETVLQYYSSNVSFETFMSDLEKTHGENVNFYFPNNVFPQEEMEENSSYDRPEWKHLPGTNLLMHMLREEDNSGYNTGKLVLDPRSVLQMEVHSVVRHFPGGRTERIQPDLGRLFHIRRKKDSKLKRSDLIRDEGLLKVAQTLVEKVNHALYYMGLNTATGLPPH
ncbi:hypothetical protein NHX12_020915 [Muraenolepis orangiensis]|uniref:Glycosyltransferase family 92 protein n=1 Tax=Muraenolepis orangiensis TaxID=630683 RepID=A0A9Q0ESU9_9TELE|nr:hypothetical protein NHX12_020915 [Muraenolepis orangiensis]